MTKKLRTSGSSESTGQKHEMESEKPWVLTRVLTSWASFLCQGSYEEEGRTRQVRSVRKMVPKTTVNTCEKNGRWGGAYLGLIALHVRVGNDRR